MPVVRDTPTPVPDTLLASYRLPQCFVAFVFQLPSQSSAAEG